MDDVDFAGWTLEKSMQVIKDGPRTRVLVKGRPYMSWPSGDEGSARMAMVQLSDCGLGTQEELARVFEVHVNSVQRYLTDFEREGMRGLVSGRSGRKQPWKLTPTLRGKILLIVLREGIGKLEAIQQRLADAWQEEVHRTFKLSRDPKFLEKLTDVVGLYLNPPQKAVVLCVEEKSQIQALDRTQPGLPLKKGRCGTYTHDYVRNGTTTLFAALELLEGKVIGQCQAHHRHQEWLKFLRRLDADFPSDLGLHLVMDNYGTHKEPHVVAWLKRHPRFVCHFIPTSSSWLNLVERWFQELGEKAIRRGAFVSVPDLVQAIESFLAAWNEAPRPFVWTATVESIVKKLDRARAKLEQVKPGCTQPRRRKSE